MGFGIRLGICKRIRARRKKSNDIRNVVKRGAVIIDVRTPIEFQQGHVKGAYNFPLVQFQSFLNGIDRDLPVITCCTSGMRSAAAIDMLKASGFKDVHDGGGWFSLQGEIADLL